MTNKKPNPWLRRAISLRSTLARWLRARPPRPTPRPAGEPVLRGTHYFGDAWPVNFWNSARFEHLARDFAAIAADGFNAIVLVVPWGEFQPDVPASPAIDEFAMDRLQSVLEAARASDLKVVLRIGYGESFTPHPGLDSTQRTLAFLESPEVRHAYFAFVARIRQEADRHSHISFAFLSWEDLFLPGLLARADLRARLTESALMADWRAFLAEGVSMDRIQSVYGQAFADLQQVPLPEPGTPQERLVHAFWDWFLIHRLFKPASAGFARLSFEARIDDDPVNNELGRLELVPHESTYRMPGAALDVTYWTVSWAMENRSDRISASRSIGGLKKMLTRMEGHTRRCNTFIDQFVFHDSTPGLGHLTRMHDHEVGRFFRRAGSIIANRTLGYALWAHKAYRWNMLYNAGFERGLLGWECEGPAQLQATASGYHLDMDTGASVSQAIPGTRQGRGLNYREFCLRATARADCELRVECGGHTLLLTLPAGPLDQCHAFEAPWGHPLKITLVSGRMLVERFILSVHTEGTGLYTADGAPTPYAAALREFNASIARRRPWWQVWRQ